MDHASATPATPFLTPEVAAEVRDRFGTPCYVYDRAALEARGPSGARVPAPFGFTLRYAMKANPSRGILRVFRELGLHIDASSDFEVERAIQAGFQPAEIQLTSQMPSRRLGEHVRRGRPVQRVLHPSARQLRQDRAGDRGVGPDESRARDRLHEAHQHRWPRVELRDLARVSRRGQDGGGAAPAADHATPLPRGLRHRPRDLEALHADDARAGGEAARGPRGQSRRRLQGGPDARGADGRPRRRGRARPRRSSWTSSPGTAVASPSRSSPARSSWRAPARWWRAASTWWTPGATGTCSPSSTPA